MYRPYQWSLLGLGVGYVLGPSGSIRGILLRGGLAGLRAWHARIVIANSGLMVFVLRTVANKRLFYRRFCL